MISNEIIEKAKALNTEAAELNEKRKQAEWAKKKAEEDLNRALAEYNAKYGTNLGVADIEKAYAAEEKRVQEQIAKVEAEIEAVKNGATEVVEVRTPEVKQATEAEVSNDAVNKIVEQEEHVTHVTSDVNEQPVNVVVNGAVQAVQDEHDEQSPQASQDSQSDGDDSSSSDGFDFDFSKYLN